MSSEIIIGSSPQIDNSSCSDVGTLRLAYIAV